MKKKEGISEATRGKKDDELDAANDKGPQDKEKKKSRQKSRTKVRIQVPAALRLCTHARPMMVIQHGHASTPWTALLFFFAGARPFLT